MAVKKNHRVGINFYKKHCLLFVTWNKSNLSKQVVPVKYTLEKRFFGFAILCDLFTQSKKSYDIPSSVGAGP